MAIRSGESDRERVSRHPDRGRARKQAFRNVEPVARRPIPVVNEKPSTRHPNHAPSIERRPVLSDVHSFPESSTIDNRLRRTWIQPCIIETFGLCRIWLDRTSAITMRYLTDGRL